MKRETLVLLLKYTVVLAIIAVTGTTGYLKYYNEQQEGQWSRHEPHADIRGLNPETKAPAKRSFQESRDEAMFGVELQTRGPGFERVLQSFAFDEFTGEIYTVQDASNSNNNILLNKLSSDGKSLGYHTLANFGHGNGLGLERLPDGSIRLWTDYIPVDSKGYGTKLVRFNFDNPTETTSYDLCPPGYKVPFVAIDNEKRLLIMRATNKKAKEERVFIYSLKDVLKGGKTPKSSFVIDAAQEAQSFQGIHAKDDVIYIITGDSSIYTPKLLYGYDMAGQILFKKKVGAGINFAAKLGDYYEPEGLYVHKDPQTGNKRVYLGIVTGQPYDAINNPRGRISRLYYYEGLE